MAEEENEGATEAIVEFAGLFSFVRRNWNPSECSPITVLAVNADRGLVRPRLCEHFPVLTFLQDDFQSDYAHKFRGRDPEHRMRWVASSQRSLLVPPEHLAIGILPLQGKVLRISRSGSPCTNRCGLTVADDFFKVVDLSHLGAGKIDRRWLRRRPRRGSIVSARLEISEGCLTSQDMISGVSWFNEAGQTKAAPVEYNKTARWTLPTGGERLIIEAVHYRKRILERLVLEPDSRIVISNFCGVEHADQSTGDDVKAFYDLCVAPVRQKWRFAPRVGSAPRAVGGNYCPPGRQTG